MCVCAQLFEHIFSKTFTKVYSTTSKKPGYDCTRKTDKGVSLVGRQSNIPSERRDFVKNISDDKLF